MNTIGATNLRGEVLEEALQGGEIEAPVADPAANRHRVAMAQSDPWRISVDANNRHIRKVFNRKTIGSLV